MPNSNTTSNSQAADLFDKSNGRLLSGCKNGGASFLRLCFCVTALFIASNAFAQFSITTPPEFVDDLTSQTVVGSDAKQVIVLIHGWDPQGDTDKYEATDEWFYLKNILHVKLAASDWKLVLYHWESDANTGYIGWDQMPLVQNAANAADRAILHGDYLGYHLNQIAPDLRQVHLIAHSAGSWAAYRAAQYLLQLNPYLVVQVTLLDPYIPRTSPFPLIPVSSLTLDMMNNLAFVSQNDRLYRLENYFAEDTYSVGYQPLGTLGTDNTFSWRGQDINQRVDHGATGVPGLNLWYDSHAGPIEFYGDTVSASILGNSVPIGLNTLDPSFVTLGWNRSLSAEFFLIPRINTHPQDTVTTSGSSVTLSVSAVNSQTMSYQWFKDGTPISGATSSSYSFTASSSTIGDYVARVSNINGTIFSDKAAVSLTTPSAPVVSYVTPSTLTGLPLPQAQLIRVIGSGFTGSSTLLFNGSIASDPARLYFITPTEIDYYIRTDSNAASWTVKVINGAQQSNLGYFTVVAPSPTTGSLAVNLAPSGAVSAGAQWRVDTGSYFNSGDVATSLSPGSHTVSFKAVSGYNTPASQNVDILANQQTSTTGTYSVITPSTYTLTINYNPTQGGASPSPLVPQTSSTYGSYSFGYTANATTLVQASASTGYHFAGWSGDASGSANPITVTMSGNRNITANFAPGDPNLGTFTVTIQPPEAAAAGVTWGFNETDFRASGSSVTTYPGNFLMYVHVVSGWSGAGVFPVTIVAGQTTNYVVAVSSTTGSTVGTDPRTYSTLAGLAGNTGSIDGTNSTARFSSPWHIAVDTGGNLYVADYGNNIIRKITPAGVVSTLAGLAGNAGSADGNGSAARFNMPIGIAVDTNGFLYVGEYGNSTIRKITPEGVVSTLAGLAGVTGSADGTGSAARFKNPTGVTVSSSGNVYVADYGNYTIRKITPGGTVSTLAGVAGSHATTDGVGTAARFFYPSGIAVDNAGILYVSDTFNHTIRKITSDGTVSTLAGFPGSGGAADGTGTAARFSYPEELAVDGIGNVYVADNNNSVIRKITSAGAASTLAGLSGHIGSTDGDGGTVRFRFAKGLAIDSTGNLFVADGGNSTIRTTRQVGKSDQLITFAPLPDKSAGDAPFTLTASASSGLPVAFSIISGAATVSNNLVTLTGGGTVTVRASQSGNANFNAAPDIDRSFVVTKLPQTINFGALSKQVVGDAPFALSASASSGLPVSFSVLSGPVILSGNLVTITGAGLAVLRASQSGDTTNAPAPNMDQVLIIAPGNNVFTDYQRLGNGMFTLRFYGDTGTNYVLEASTNLVNWVPVATNQVSGLGYLEFTDGSSTNFDRRFYKMTP